MKGAVLMVITVLMAGGQRWLSAALNQFVCVGSMAEIYTLTKIILKTCGQYTSNGIHSKFHLGIMYFLIDKPALP